MTNARDDNDEFDELPAVKSKSQVKREMTALQELGKRLTQLNAEQLTQVPMPDNLAEAVAEYQRARKNEAKRRQLQYIGRLMRDVDADAIQGAINLFDARQVEHTRHFHQLEQWRTRLLDEPQATTEFLEQYPSAEAQQLRQMIRSAQKQRAQQKDTGGSRKLFRYLREIVEASD